MVWYDVGDKVMVHFKRKLGVSSKLAHEWDSVYEVVERKTPLVYAVRKMEPRAKIMIVGVRKMKKYYARTNESAAAAAVSSSPPPPPPISDNELEHKYDDPPAAVSSEPTVSSVSPPPPIRQEPIAARAKVWLWTPTAPLDDASPPVDSRRVGLYEVIDVQPRAKKSYRLWSVCATVNRRTGREHREQRRAARHQLQLAPDTV